MVEVEERRLHILHMEDKAMETRKEKIKVEWGEWGEEDRPLKTDLRIFIVRKKEGRRWRQDLRGARRHLKDV